MTGLQQMAGAGQRGAGYFTGMLDRGRAADYLRRPASRQPPDPGNRIKRGGSSVADQAWRIRSVGA